MKKIVSKPVTVEKVVERVTEQRDEVVDEPGGFEPLLGKQVLLFCNYFYLGKLVGINHKCVELESPSIVYETGNWTGKLKDVQALPVKTICVMMDAIESFMELPR